MIIPLNASKLRMIIGNLFQTVNASAVLPILESVLISVKEGKISYYVSDLENVMEYEEETEALGEIMFCIHSKSFIFFLRNAMEDKCTIDVDDKKVKLSCGAFCVSFERGLYDVGNFPVRPVLDNVLIANFKYELLSTNISAALKFVSKDNLRPAMTGVYFHTDGLGLKIAATDAHSMYFDTVTPIKEKITPFILSSKSSRLFISNFKGQSFDLFQDKNYTTFKSKKITLICRNIDARYPDYKNVIVINDLNFYFKRKQLLSFLKISTEYVNRSSYMSKFEISQDKMESEGGDIDFSIEFNYTIPVYNASSEFSKFTFGVNIQFLKRIIEISKDEYVKINHSTLSTKSFIIDDKFLLMPLQLNN